MPGHIILLMTLALGFLGVPLGAQAPPETIHRIGVLRLAAPPEPSIAAFRQGLHDFGYFAEQNLVIEERYAEDHLNRLPTLMADLLRLEVEVIVALGGPAARAAQQATKTIPIVVTVGDVLEQGLVTNLARPGGEPHRVHQYEPGAQRQAAGTAQRGDAPHRTRGGPVVSGPRREPSAMASYARRRPSLGHRAALCGGPCPAEVEAIVSTVTRAGADAMVVFDCALFSSQEARTTTLPLPAIYPSSTFARAGGLMSYGAYTSGLYRRVAAHVDKILKGANPGDLPIEQPTTFELVINLKTAQALGLTLPPSLLFQATEVIR
jgi:ABC-type uncharacterized transport system substrate-binding protein